LTRTRAALFEERRIIAPLPGRRWTSRPLGICGRSVSAGLWTTRERAFDGHPEPNVLPHVDVGVDVDVDLDVNGDMDGDDLLSLTNA
jgi:hypothetical protein